MQRDGEVSDLGRLLFEQANQLTQQRQLGMEHGHAHAARDLKALFLAYDRAVLEPATRIPTMLHLTIEELRKKYAT